MPTPFSQTTPTTDQQEVRVQHEALTTGGSGAQLDPEKLEALAQEVYRLLRQELRIERERLGQRSKRF